jgi:hypothetical protein
MENLPITQGPASIEMYSENLQQKLSFCQVMLKSGMVPQAYKTPESVLIAVLFGRELGFSPLRSLHMISVIQGTPTINAMGMKALALSKGGRFKVIQWDFTKCKLLCIRGDWQEEYEYSWKDAEIAQLTTKDNWKKNPKAMLFARCVSIGCRNMWTDLLGGMYSTEEMIDSLGEEIIDSVDPEQLQHAATEEALDKIVQRKTLPVENQNAPLPWDEYKYRYHLPTKKAGWNMQQVRDSIKAKGFRFNEYDSHWYGSVELVQLKDYLRPLNIEDLTPTGSIEITDADINAASLPNL